MAQLTPAPREHVETDCIFERVLFPLYSNQSQRTPKLKPPPKISKDMRGKKKSECQFPC